MTRPWCVMVYLRGEWQKVEKSRYAYVSLARAAALRYSARRSDVSVILRNRDTGEDVEITNLEDVGE